MARGFLNRRTFLRGVLGSSSVCVGLPLLESMLDRKGTALASGAALPIRFGTWFWGLGPADGAFFPKAAGAGWETPPALRDMLAAYPQIKPQLSLVSGALHDFVGTGHHESRAAALSGSHDLRARGLDGRGGPALPSLDQFVADAWKGQTRLRSIEIRVTQAKPWPNSTSFAAGGQRIPSEDDPKKVFDRLFGGGVPQQVDDGTDPRRAQRSVLDVLLADTQALKRRVLPGDRVRIDEWLDNLRLLEKRVMSPRLECQIPAIPNNPAQAEKKHEIMVDLLATALACDITRVFSIEWSGTQSEFRYSNLGAPAGHHKVTHEHRSYAEPISRYILKQFGYLVDRLRQTPDGIGSVLDNSLVFNTCEYSRFNLHRLEPHHPMLIAGAARGNWNAGVHHALPTGDKGTRVMLTMMQAIGLPIKGYGMRARPGSQSNRVKSRRNGSGDSYTENAIAELRA